MTSSPCGHVFLEGVSSFWPFAVDTALAPTDMALRHARFTVDAFQPDAFRLFDIARPERLERAIAKRQAEYLAGRVCARAALSRYGLGDHDLTALPDRRPAWPAGIVGAITHSRDFAAALAADATRWQGLGIDAEHPLDAARAERLKTEILTATELAWAADFSPERLARFVTLVFSAKESVFKALYPLVGRRFYFHDARLIAWDERTGGLDFELLIPLGPDWPAGARLAGCYGELADQLVTLIAIPAERGH